MSATHFANARLPSVFPSFSPESIFLSLSLEENFVSLRVCPS